MFSNNLAHLPRVEGESCFGNTMACLIEVTKPIKIVVIAVADQCKTVLKSGEPIPNSWEL